MSHTLFCFVTICLFVGSNAQSLVVDTCTTANTGRFGFEINGFQVCQLNGLNFEFVAICQSVAYSCPSCNFACQNGGACVLLQGTSVPFCLCTENWGGPICEARVNNCTIGEVCESNGTLSLTCALSYPYMRGYFIDECEVEGTNCSPTTCSLNCQNSGRCINTSSGDRCLCPRLYSGATCQTMSSTPPVISALCPEHSDYANLTTPTNQSAVSTMGPTNGGVKIAFKSTLLPVVILAIYFYFSFV